jgi:spore coat protein U-like protein
MFARLIWSLLASLIAASALVATPATACTATAALATDFGSYSPAATKAGAVPGLPSRAGLACVPSTLLLLSGNYIRATFKSRNGLKLSGSGGTVGYSASADPGATVAFTQNGTVDYMQNNLLNLLGLLGSSNADFPFYVKPAGGTAPGIGTYTDRITIIWDWYICPGIGALGLCIGTPDSGSAQTVIDVTLTIAARDVTTALATVTTWDAANGTNYPKAIPGSRQRTSLTLANPDIVPLDAGSLAIVLPTPNGSLVALDGDGASAGAAIGSSEGSTPSTLTVSYGDPASASDDVDFSADGGATWTYAPAAGNLASQAAVTHVRVRPRGAMAKQSTFTISVPYMLR